MTGITQPVRSTQTLKQTELGGGPTFKLDIYAVNDLDSSSVTMVKVTVSAGEADTSQLLYMYSICVCLCFRVRSCVAVD